MTEIKQNPRTVRVGDLFSIDNFAGVFLAEKCNIKDGCQNCCASFANENDVKLCSKMPDSCRFNPIVYKRITVQKEDLIANEWQSLPENPIPKKAMLLFAIRGSNGVYCDIGKLSASGDGVILRGGRLLENGEVVYAWKSAPTPPEK